MTENKNVEKTENLQEIDMDKLDISESNVRKTNIDADVYILSKSIERWGLEHPIKVRYKEDEGRYKIIMGQRRYLACKKLGWTKIPAFVIDKESPENEDKVRSLIENIDRRDLTAVDKADAVLDLLEQYDGNWAKLTEILNRSERTLKDWVKYESMSSTLQKMVTDKNLSKKMALKLSAYSEASLEDKERIADKIASVDTQDEKNAILQYVKKNPRANLYDVNKAIPGIYVGISFNAMVSRAIKLACKETEVEGQYEPKDFIKKLTTEYLYDKGFLVGTSGVLSTPRDTSKDSDKVVEPLSEDEIRKLEKKRQELRKSFEG